MSACWTIPRDWCGAIAIVVGGGPSAADADLSLLRGHKVIAVNGSHERVPFADLLFTGDCNWWQHCGRAARRTFAGPIAAMAEFVTPSDGVLRLRNSRPNPFSSARKPDPPLRVSEDRQAVPVRRTSITGAMNVADLRGARGIIALGLDGQAAPDGRMHHHAEYPWKARDGWAARQHADLRPFAAELGKRLPVINASPGSAFADLFPVMTLPQALAALGAQTERAAA